MVERPHREALGLLSRGRAEKRLHQVSPSPELALPMLSDIQSTCIEEWPSLSVLRLTWRTSLAAEFQPDTLHLPLPQSAVLQCPAVQHWAFTRPPHYLNASPKPGSSCSCGKKLHSHQALTSHMKKHREKNGGVLERMHRIWVASSGRFTLCWMTQR